MVEPIAAELGVSAAELLAGCVVTNTNRAANMLRSKFYVCPVCGNVVFSSGEAHVSCHGIVLPPLEAEPADGDHAIEARMVEDELYVRSSHSMDKVHHITFLAALSLDRVQLVRLYPEGPCEARFRRAGVRDLYLFCRRDGLFHVKAADALRRK